MNSLKKFILILLLTPILSGCIFTNIQNYTDTTESFVNSILEEDYNKGRNYVVGQGNGITNDQLSDFRRHITNIYGTDLSYSFLRSEKTISTNQSQNSHPGTTQVFIQFSNGKLFNRFSVLFDDASKKIININISDKQRLTPSVIPFILFILLAICVPVFNIYVIIQICRSDLKKKWLKCLAVLVFNLPTLVYGAYDGISFNLLDIQILLGVSFQYAGYLSAISFGIPLGGIYWYNKLNKRYSVSDKQEQETKAQPE